MAKKPKGAYSKQGGVSNVKFTGKSAMDKFQNYAVNVAETTETRKDRAENPSKLYAAARKLGINQNKVKSQIDSMAKQQKRDMAGVEKKTSVMDMQDMMRRSAANTAARKAAGLKGAAAGKVSKVYKTY